MATALHIASANCYLDVVRYLLEYAAADVHVKVNHSPCHCPATVFYIQTSNKNVDLVKLTFEVYKDCYF